MRVEIDMNAKEIADQLKVTAKKQARAILKEEIQQIIKDEINHNKEIKSFIDETIRTTIESEHVYMGYYRDHEGFKDLTQRDEEMFEQGATMAHLLDLKDEVGPEKFESLLLYDASHELFDWVKSRGDLQNKLALALYDILKKENARDAE